MKLKMASLFVFLTESTSISPCHLIFTLLATCVFEWLFQVSSPFYCLNYLFYQIYQVMIVSME